MLVGGGNVYLSTAKGGGTSCLFFGKTRLREEGKQWQTAGPGFLPAISLRPAGSMAYADRAEATRREKPWYGTSRSRHAKTRPSVRDCTGQQNEPQVGANTYKRFSLSKTVVVEQWADQ